MKEFDEEADIKRKVKKDQKKNSSTTTLESSKDKSNKFKSIYEKDVEDLSKYPYERKKNSGYGFS